MLRIFLTSLCLLFSYPVAAQFSPGGCGAGLCIQNSSSGGGGGGSVFNGGKSETNFAGLELNFLNIMKSAQPWTTVSGITPDPDPVTGFNFDTNGYPRNIPGGTSGLRALTVIPTNAERSWSDVSPGVTGAYTFTWDGGGTIYVSGYTLVSGSLTSSALSTNNTVTLRPTLNRPFIGVSAVTSSTDYPKNFKLYYTADQADVTAGKILSVQARQRWAMERVGSVRYLNFQAGDGGTGNSNMMTTWSTRKPVDHWSYGAPEIRTSIYAGVTTMPITDQYSLTFNDPVYGTNPADDKQTIQARWNANQTGTRSYLTYNGRQDLICNPFGGPADPTGSVPNTGVPAINQYTTLIYDALLQCWLNFNGGNAAPASTFLENGVPPEVQLQVAIELGAHPYFLTPTYAADAGTGTGQMTDYMSSFVDMVRAGTPSWMIPTWEPVNEWWNSIFRVTAWSNARQLIRNGGPRPGQTVAPYQVTSLTYTAALTVTGTSAGAGGKVRLTVASTASLTTGEFRTVSTVGGTVEANGVWKITVISGTTVDLDGSTYSRAWTSGGSISGQVVMQVNGTLPPLGAQITSPSLNGPSGLFGFGLATGYVTSVGVSSVTFDTPPSGGSWSGNTGTATLTLVGSTVSVPYATQNQNAIVLSTTGSLPAPLVAGTVYYIITGGTSGTPFQIALTPGGAAIDFSAGSQSGTHTGLQVIAFNGVAGDYHNDYGATASTLGQMLSSKYGGSPKTQTAYRFAIGVQGSLANYYPSGTVGSDPRATSKNLILTSGNSANMAKFYATHMTPANYFHTAAYASGAQTTALENAWNGTLFTAGIVNGVMTVASFQNSGTQNMAAGQVVFGYGLPAPFGGSQVTIVSGPAGCTTTCTGTGVYILSDPTINVASGTQLYSGADATAPQAYINASAGTYVTATISNGSGGSGNQMVITAITPAGPAVSPTVYLNSTVFGTPITANTTISSQSAGSAGCPSPPCTYLLSRNLLVSTPTQFLITGTSAIESTNIYLTNWKTWAQSYDINKMLFYEGGWSPDYTNNGLSKADLLRFAAKWVLTSSSWPNGMQSLAAQNFALIDAMTSGGFVAEFPSSYYFEGRYPSNNAWSVLENIYFPIIAPQAKAFCAYNGTSC